MIFSVEQLAIFDWFKSGTGNLVIEAYAGTGKTTTIKHAFEHAPEKSILYAVFNKKNQVEAKEKITDSRVDVRTLHSLGYGYIKNVWRNAKPDSDVEFDRIKQVVGIGCEDREYIAAIEKLVGFAKNTCINPSEDDLLNIIDIQEISASGISERELCGAALSVLSASKIQDVQGRISFNDMVWLPVAMNWVKQKFYLVACDESQDMSLPQLTMVKQCCVTGGRIVVVGDSRQAIYGFRGAVQNAMRMMQTTLSAKVLTLSTTYRCPKSVVKIANEIVPGYNAADSALDGEVKQVIDTLSATPGDAILSRLNAPLMPLALNLLRRGVSARIEGRDIGRQLVGMVKSQKAKSVPNFLEKINGWFNKQVERLSKSKNGEKRIEQSRDILDTLVAVAEGADSVADIERKINNLFQDSDTNSKPAVILSSVHKAKGLEWKRVFILTETFRRGKGIEEDNIYYVAVTRSQHSLFFVGSGEKGQQGKDCAVLPQVAAVKEAGGLSPNVPIAVTSNIDLCVTNQTPGVTANIAVESVKLPKRSRNAGKAQTPGKISLRLPDKTYTEYFQGCQPVRVEEYNTPDFTAAKVRPAIEPKQSDETTTENNTMAKAKSKKTESTKKPGKIAFVDELLQSGKHTKNEVAEKLNKEFGVVIKTAKNTVNWAASTMEDRIGKKSKHLPSVAAAKSTKPAKKLAAKKKTTVPKRKVKPAVVAVPEPVTA